MYVSWCDSRDFPFTHVISNTECTLYIALQRFFSSRIQCTMCDVQCALCILHAALMVLTIVRKSNTNISIECCNRACDYTIVLYVVNTCQVTLTASHFLTTTPNGCDFAIEIEIFQSSTSVMGGRAKATSDPKLILYCYEWGMLWIHFTMFDSRWKSDVERIR